MPQTTLSQLESRVYAGLDGNALEFPEPFVRMAINQGLYRLNLLLGLFQDTLAITGKFTVAGQREYNIPAGILFPLRVDYEGSELQRVSLERLARAYRNWAVDTTDDLGPVIRWASLGMSRFVIHPIDALGGSLLEVTGVVQATPLAIPGDVVTLENQFTEILVLYARTRVLAKEGGKPFRDLALQFQEMWKQVRVRSLWRNQEFPLYWLARQTRPSGGRRL